MAGLTPGARSPQAPQSGAATERIPLRIPASSRTRCVHGVFPLGAELATVYSSRRESDGLGVALAISTGSLLVTVGMTTDKARAIARALEAAARAAELRPARHLVRIGRDLEGGAA